MRLDIYTKVLLTVIAINLTVLTGWQTIKLFVPDVVAQQVVPVRIISGQAAHEVEVYCTNC